MSFEEFVTPLCRPFSHNVLQKTTKISLRPPSDIFKTKVSSNLALQSTDYGAPFTLSR